MSDHQKNIYQSEGDQYQALIAWEDYEGNIPRAIGEIVNVKDMDVLDLGAGTGRLTLLLARRVRSIHAFDASAEMLRVCRERLLATGLSNWQVDVADHRQLPLVDHAADLVVSGWSVSYLAVWDSEHGQAEMDTWMREMKRVLRPGGSIILFESLGTGYEEPYRLPHVEPAYQWMETHGFESKWIRTDFRFPSVEQAAESLGFFFGAEMADQIRSKGSAIVPECTGVWWRNI